MPSYKYSDTRINFIFKKPKFSFNVPLQILVKWENFVQLSSFLVSYEKSTEPLPDHPNRLWKSMPYLLSSPNKSLIRMQRCPNITKDNSSQSTSECLFFFFTSWGLSGFPNVCHPAFRASLIHPNLVVLPQLLLTHNTHILPFQHPEAANSSITWTTIQHSFCCRREHYKQPKVLAEHERCSYEMWPIRNDHLPQKQMVCKERMCSRSLKFIPVWTGFARLPPDFPQNIRNGKSGIRVIFIEESNIR